VKTVKYSDDSPVALNEWSVTTMEEVDYNAQLENVRIVDAYSVLWLFNFHLLVFVGQTF
jgi:hypothetical protein